MAGRLVGLWRHPIKGIGAEPLDRVELAPGGTMPWDRVWAVAHEAARLDPGSREWAPCANFLRGAKSPEMMAIRARLDEAAGRVSLVHPRAGGIEVDPDDPADRARLIDWLHPLVGPGRAAPAFVVRGARAMTDSALPAISILNRASLRALGQRMGMDLAPERFRGNLWLDGLGPWEEFEWIGREIAIGPVRFAVRERIGRCRATSVDPATGRIDGDTLAALEAGWGHTDFGVYAVVVAGGPLALGDPVAP